MSEWELSRARWREAEPDLALTWNEALDGLGFIDAVNRYAGFDAQKRLLEIGPGYGRLIESMLERGYRFRSYLGLDISNKNIEFLTGKYPGSRMKFVQGDAELVSLPEKFDVIYSSATFHHFYPDNRQLLRNLAKALSAKGVLCFDLIEGNKAWFDGATYMRWYERAEITAILEESNLRLVQFDEVQHTQKRKRLFVVAAPKASPFRQWVKSITSRLGL
ncbi:MAG TPA: class I SAM-dependent methyltransferase [Dongiaceae bacterium]|jgi:SAM-dependent methyltransferase|nr:class I SAM-dependent methyltransferase [Dongiaceae bacterium]